LKEFGELIYDHETKAFYDFIVYFSSKNSLELYYIDTNKRYNVYINPNDFNSIIPEYEFETILVKDNKLTLTYGQKKKIIVDLKNTPAISN
jgi:hypothetical protein